jgi:hypothetical protein
MRVMAVAGREGGREGGSIVLILYTSLFFGLMGVIDNIVGTISNPFRVLGEDLLVFGQ